MHEINLNLFDLGHEGQANTPWPGPDKDPADLIQ